MFIGVLCVSLFSPALAQTAEIVKSRYTKSEHMILMRDGVKLFTVIYAPKDRSQKYPILLNRTPYSVGPYGPDRYKTDVGPSLHFQDEGYIFVYQDVRGKFQSEGTFEFMRPYIPKKQSNKDVDESSDTYDTIEWLLKSVSNHNGKVGVWGISYPGFQAAMAAIDAHPNLVAVSPQAPMTDIFIGDDFHHNGAFFLTHAFRWLAGSAPARTNRNAITRRPSAFDYGTPDGVEFFLRMGPLPNADKLYFKGAVPVWNEFMQHGTYDDYWKSRDVIRHLKNIKPAVMTVAGWFDSEDKYGAAHLYGQIERSNPGIKNIIVWGPWHHGGWARVDGDTLGHIRFGQKTSLYYREHIELPFFNYYLKGKGDMKLPEATAFMTGANEWKTFDAWPPKEAQPTNLYFQSNGKLSFQAPSDQASTAFDEYVSDPGKPVPFTAAITAAMGHTYMVEDQRFAWTRPDVLVYQTDVLQEDVTIAGPVTVELYGSTSGTDCDWVVKLIDVHPGTYPGPNPNPPGVQMGGFQMKLVSDVMRAKFRNSFEQPEALEPNKPTKIVFDLSDKLHRFRKGHKIMVQVQSTWFPLVDRNPGRFVDIYHAKESDYQKTTQRVYRSASLPSHLTLRLLKSNE
ncbi:MAG: CocE/NonD family hydrolase [Ignavibacteriales bacterium]|nr:CocE/NonD family hydrolase [Ignavibacteriales bacterium]